MSSQSLSNVSAVLQYEDFLERVITFTLCTVPACVFLFVNGVMLFILRSKPVFHDSCRYILLYNLLLADTVHLVVSQILFLLGVCRIILTYPVCGTITTFASLITVISPLTLVVMSLERYVAVCFPLRHASIITIRNTRVAVIGLWAFGSFHNLTRVVLMLDFPFEKLESLQMKGLCYDFAMLVGSKSNDYDKSFTSFLFVSSGVVIVSSYIGVIIAARSASTDKASVLKARNTLLLHLVQLCFSLSSTIYSPVLVSLKKILAGIIFMRLHIFLYIVIILFPRCLSSLIYGLRDQTIRPVLLHHLCCRQKV
ncbi:odorant receptor 131-2-like [Nothobranchius furzeri]|uniref:Olfactory receptor 4N2-like n=1 Tax=Nothobranchius furzeri TaxID=105023 RepID=A0A8C6LHP5_NOTFU|nr:olfactory receptor 4N2-like [Nothobranchius furzeri]